jgi:hypothetical protein
VVVGVGADAEVLSVGVGERAVDGTGRGKLVAGTVQRARIGISWSAVARVVVEVAAGAEVLSVGTGEGAVGGTCRREPATRAVGKVHVTGVV